jgi:hypothetical protein
MAMNKYLLFILLGFISCVNIQDKVFDPQKEIEGDWLILYPKHILKNDAQRKIYGVAQDSIVNLFGLKLISFTDKGQFLQVDSLFGVQGNWKVKDTTHLEVRSVGKGFELFNGNIVGIINDTILIEQMVPIDRENIKLIWHLKKMGTENGGTALFKRDNNLWRQRPQKKENEAEIKSRVVKMLKYYSLYFKVVSKESIYFSPARVSLPFTYFQHGVGLKMFDNDFEKCFFDTDDARKGYQLLKNAFEETKSLDFPSGSNFVIEYSEYFQRLADYFE